MKGSSEEKRGGGEDSGEELSWWGGPSPPALLPRGTPSSHRLGFPRQSRVSEVSVGTGIPSSFWIQKRGPRPAAPSPPVPILALQHLGGSYAQEKTGSRESPAQSAEFPSLPLGHRESPLPTIWRVGWKVPPSPISEDICPLPHSFSQLSLVGGHVYSRYSCMHLRARCPSSILSWIQLSSWTRLPWRKPRSSLPRC